MEAFFLADGVTDSAKAGIGGLCVGILFGVFAQRSRFCLRSACIEFWTAAPGGKLAVWLACFGAALFLTQGLVATDSLALQEVRQVSSTGTLSGAVLGGVLFGVGMILARGCASRLLVLSATGNLRALVAGLVVTVVAQAALSGVLSPLRIGLSGIWTVGPAWRDMAGWLPSGTGLAAGGGCLIAALVLARVRQTPMSAVLASAVVGGSVALGWWFTSSLAAVSFDPVPVGSVTFTGPSADTLMAFITTPEILPSFSLGLVPGVFAGSFLASVIGGEFRLQTFDRETGMARYLVGACLMGFGGMLAGGCAVGAGVTGGSVLSMTAWVALLAMWLGAGAALAAERVGFGVSPRFG